MRNDYIDSNVSRRQLLRHLGIAGAGALAATAACGWLWGCKNDGVAATNKQLLLYGTGTLDIKDWSQLKSDLGISLKFTDNGNDTGPVITQMVAGRAAKDFDLGGLQGGAEKELADAGAILPWDLSKIPAYAKIWDWAQSIPYLKHQSQHYGIPIAINADSMIYLPDEVGHVDSYAAVFDPKLKGRTSMEDAWINSAIFAAIFLKQNGIAKINDPGDLTPDELGTVMEFLIEKKRAGQFRKFWNGWEEGVNLLKNKEVVVMTGWEPIVKALKQQNVNAEYAVPKEGYEGWSNDLLLHSGARDRGVVDVAHQFANWELDGYYGCRLSQLRGYVVPTDRSADYAKAHADVFNPTEVETSANHVRDKFLKMNGRVFWQNVRPRNYKLYDDWWSKLRNA